MLWGGRWEGGSCLGTHVRIKDFKIKKKIKKFKNKKKKIKEMHTFVLLSQAVTSSVNWEQVKMRVGPLDSQQDVSI